jgi:murein DD-endopeptidase MepM/ murein hydrolase activator NlpD
MGNFRGRTIGPAARHFSARWAVLVLLAFSVHAGPAVAAPELDLAGTWHVLVHYTDKNTANPDIRRWDDRVWAFTRKGRKLQWVEYPIVVFGDESGRFERRATGQHARVLGAWEPNEGQLANIQAGLKINTRGVTDKTLRGSDEEGWSTEGRRRRTSAMVITYQKSWQIEDAGTLPRFIQEDTMESMDGEEAEGSTRYETTAVEQDGAVLRGTYDRDGTRLGTFTMRRSGSVGRLEKRTQAQIQQSAAPRSLATSETARADTKRVIRESLAKSGTPLTPEQIDEVAAALVQLVIDGAPPEQLERHVEDVVRESFYGFVKNGTVHDDSARYELPFRSDAPRKLSQGVGGDITASGWSAGTFSHKGRHKYSFDFAMPIGISVVAAREGNVVLVVDGYTKGGAQRGLAGRANTVTVQHADGTFAVYAHLSQGILVAKGDRVEAGAPLGLSGNTGFTTAPHLHFGVRTADEDGTIRSVLIHFDDGSPEGFVPVEGAYYGGGSN